MLVSSSGVFARMSFATVISRVSNPGDKFRPDRQFSGAKRQGLAGKWLRNTIDLKHDPAGMHTRNPEFRAALPRPHTHLGWFGGDRKVRKNPYPHTAGTLHCTCDGTTGRLNLARGNPFRFQSLQTESTEIQLRVAFGQAVDATFMSFPEFCTLRR
jgi:hypothetical protein